MMIRYYYFPVIKTRDSELKAYRMLPDEVKNGIMPIFELTKSRITSKNPNGTVYKRLDVIKEMVDTKPFILDLSSEQSYTNTETEIMLLNKNDNGYEEWTDFISHIINEYKFTIIPVLNYNELTEQEIKPQAEKLLKSCKYLAFKVYDYDGDVELCIQKMAKYIDISKVFLIIDFGYLKHPSKKTTIPSNYNYSSQVVQYLNFINDNKLKFKDIIYIFSSFPASVTEPGYRSSPLTIKEGSEYDYFYISEIITSKGLINQPVCNGDYSSIHPKVYDSFGKWVPRIDFLDNDQFYYYRRDRGSDSNGAYHKIAQQVKNDINYNIISEYEVWGDNEIKYASEGNANGISPSHWISVRMNLYITKRFLQLKQQGYHSTTL